jgi:LysM repeat protein
MVSDTQEGTGPKPSEIDYVPQVQSLISVLQNQKIRGTALIRSTWIPVVKGSRWFMQFVKSNCRPVGAGIVSLCVVFSILIFFHRMHIEPPQQEMRELNQNTEQFLRKTDNVQPDVSFGSHEQIYILRKGDTLSHISKKYYNDPSRYAELVELNHIEDPNLIFPDQSIVVPLLPSDSE